MKKEKVLKKEKCLENYRKFEAGIRLKRITGQLEKDVYVDTKTRLALHNVKILHRNSIQEHRGI